MKPFIISSLLLTCTAIASFACWAFGGAFFRSAVSLYSACTIVFLVLGGLALLPVAKTNRPIAIVRLVAGFGIGFLGYAIIWSVCWFSLRNTFGEVLGSAIGLIAFLSIFRAVTKLSNHLSLLTAAALIFFFHTLGYYTGEFLYFSLQGRGSLDLSELIANRATEVTVARLLWGLAYGLGLGLGLSAAIYKSPQS